MLPFALKVVWFILSFTGIIACWLVLIRFGRVVGSSWGPTLYGLFVTIQQGAICLGMIWKMDPYKMPRGFCIAQTFMIYYGSYSLTGLSAVLTYATAVRVLWPSSMIDFGKSVLAYQHKYIFPVLVFPLTCLAIAVPVILKLDAIQPADGLICDSNTPVWTRFLGYAGFQFLLSVPCFFLSSAAVFRIRKMHLQSCNRLGNSVTVLDHVPAFPSQTRFLSIEPQLTGNRETSLASESGSRGTLNVPRDDAVAATMDGDHSWLGSSSHISTWPVKFPTSSPRLPNRDPGTLLGEPDGEELSHRHKPGSIPPAPIPCNGPSLGPAVWRLLLFQMTFFLIELLAALSTIIDVARHRDSPSSPFGTQQVALLLVSWGPVIVFLHFPAVRPGLLFWQRSRSTEVLRW